MPIISYLVMYMNLVGSKRTGWFRLSSAAGTAMHRWVCPVDAVSTVPH
jgi:hypothetical protein